MTTRLESRSPQVRCHECGSRELAVLCHHCGRGMCFEHARREVKPNGDPRSAEFVELGLEKTRTPFHCKDHEHVVKHRLTRYVAAAAAGVVAGVLLMFANVVLGLVVTLVSAAVGGLFLQLNKYRAAAALRVRPPVPVVPAVSKRSVRETVRGTLSLDREGRYTSSVSPVEGKLSIDMAIGRSDLERVDLYRKKFRLAEAEQLTFCAGFVALEGPVGLRFHDGPARRTVLDLIYHLADHPLFMPPSARGSGEWTLELGYGLRRDDEVESIPIWLTPSFVREQDQRALDLELQWTEFGQEGRELKIDRIDTLRLRVPIEWGNLE